MKLLLDTSAFLWMFGKPDELSEAARLALEDADNTVFLSPISIWEVLIKVGKGKLDIATGGVPVAQFLVEQRQALGVGSLPVTEPSAMQVTNLPLVHHDPFDRLLICQAIEHGLILVTRDAHIRRYPIRTLW